MPMAAMPLTVIYGQVAQPGSKASIRPGMLVLVAARHPGKIYCHAIREQGGIALDVGSCSILVPAMGHTLRRIPLNPWLSAGRNRPSTHSSRQCSGLELLPGPLRESS